MSGWAAIAAAILTVTAAQAAAQEPPAEPAATGNTYTATVLGTNGDGTVSVRLNNRKTTVRLLGVGDPGGDAGGRAACLREAADAFLAARLPRGMRATLVTGSTERDAKKRLLAWVYRPGNSGPATVNRAVVQAGLAPVADGGGTLRYATELADAERLARQDRAGRWGTVCGLATVAGIQRRLAELGYLPAGAVNGTLDYRTSQAVMAFQGWSGLPRVGTVDAATRKRLASAARPVPSRRGGSGRRVEVHIGRQVLLLIENGRVQRAIHVSTGRGGRTPRGSFTVIRRERNSWSVPFSVNLPYAQYFFRGFALHESASVPGYPASAGCVRLPSPEAPVVWDFATFGTPVTVA
jgi:endonuclease YncB( thermonuclease family)/lipoprotein-anchoring transpeptidase ErfK/SrfK